MVLICIPPGEPFDLKMKIGDVLPNTRNVSSLDTFLPIDIKLSIYKKEAA